MGEPIEFYITVRWHDTALEWCLNAKKLYTFIVFFSFTIISIKSGTGVPHSKDGIAV